VIWRKFHVEGSRPSISKQQVGLLAISRSRAVVVISSERGIVRVTDAQWCANMVDCFFFALNPPLWTVLAPRYHDTKGECEIRITTRNVERKRESVSTK